VTGAYAPGYPAVAYYFAFLFFILLVNRSGLSDTLSSARPKAPDSGLMYLLKVTGVLLTLLASFKNSLESAADLKPYLIMTSSSLRSMSRITMDAGFSACRRLSQSVFFDFSSGRNNKDTHS
jgi:hypothetical protein